MPDLRATLLRRALVALCIPLLAAASPPSVTDTAAPPAPAPAAASAGTASPPAAAPDAAAQPGAAGAPAAGAPGAEAPPAAGTAAPSPGTSHAVRRHKQVAATHARPAPAAGATVALTTQPGSELETTAAKLVASDLKQSRSAGAPPVMLVGSAKLSVKAAPAALFVQVQSADFCGSAGCSTSAYLKNGDGWTKVLDSISGPVKVSHRAHRGMYDLLVHGTDRWIWNGTAYVDTLPSPDVDLLHSVRK